VARLGAQKCAVCRHEQRYQIERLRAGGASCESLARKFGLGGKDAVWRHWRNHVSNEAKAQLLAGVSLAELAKRAEAESMSLLDYLSLVRGILLRTFMAAAESDDRHGVAITSGRLLETLRQIGTLTGEIQRLGSGNTTITNNTLILNSPVFASLQGAILSALGPFPDARVAVVAGCVPSRTRRGR
jgi:hypothetical protein